MGLVVWFFRILAFVLPGLYLFIYFSKTNNNKNIKKAYIIAFIIFFFFFFLSLMVNTMKREKENKMDTKSTTTTTTTTTTPTTKHYDIEHPYEKVKEIEGTKKDLGKTSKGYPIYEINGVTYVDGYLIANKSYFLPKDFVPIDTRSTARGEMTVQCATCINNTAYSAWLDMQADAKKAKLNIYISSGFRSYITQSNIYNRNVKNNGQATADTYSARPGSSEHQTGLCFDLNTIDSSFAYTNEGKWVNNNAYKYGYIIRYPKDSEKKTGYIYESWHLRYVGTDLSYQLYNDGNWITMEEYFGIESKYAN